MLIVCSSRPILQPETYISLSAGARIVIGAFKSILFDVWALS